MEKIYIAYGILKEIVTVIMILYRNTKSMTRSPDGDKEFFHILAGVLQGDTLAPFLFVICLDYVLRISVDKCNEYGLTLELARSRRFHTKKITDADYADDLALLSDNSYNAQKLLHILEKSVAFIGLHVDETLNKKFSLFKKVEDIVYLGCNIEQIKVFFRVVVESVLLYGPSAWTLTKRLESKLKGTYIRMLRAVLNIHWNVYPSRGRLYGNLSQITSVIIERRTRFAGHCYRSKDEVVIDLILWTPKHGKAKVGRLSKTYTKQLTEDADCQLEDLSRAIEDREYWRGRVNMVRAIRPIR